MSIFRRCLFFTLNAVVIVALTHCKARDTSGIKETKNCPTFNTSGLPTSVLNKSIPVGQMPGVIVGVKTTSFGGYDKETVDDMKNTFMDIFFERAKKLAQTGGNGDDLFYTVIALDASAVGFFRDSTILSKYKAETAQAYTKVPAPLKARFNPSRGELERFVLVVNDSDSMDLHHRLHLPEFGGYVISKENCLSEEYQLPDDKERIVETLKMTLK